MTKMKTTNKEQEFSNATQEDFFSDDSIKESSEVTSSCDTSVTVRRRAVETVSGQVLSKSDEDKIVRLLRDIVRKCTTSNAAKRPSAREILKLIEDSAPRSVLKEKFDLSDDDDDDESDDD